MNNSEICGWIGNVILVIGHYSVGSKKRWAFLAVTIGEIIWIVASSLIGSPSMIFICAVFAALSIRNWIIFNE